MNKKGGAGPYILITSVFSRALVKYEVMCYTAKGKDHFSWLMLVKMVITFDASIPNDGKILLWWFYQVANGKKDFLFLLGEDFFLEGCWPDIYDPDYHTETTFLSIKSGVIF